MNPIRHKKTGYIWTARFFFALMAALSLPFLAGNAAVTNRPPKAVAATNNVSAADSFGAFKIIAQRNIFNPNRYAGRTGARLDPNQMARAPGFALVGTIIYEKGAFAFFDGSDSQYKKVLKPSDTIADYRVVEITPSHVKLETGTNQITLAVGAQMKMIDGKWELAEGTESLEKAPESRGNSATPETVNEMGPEETSSGGSGTGTDAIMRKLMQQREKE